MTASVVYCSGPMFSPAELWEQALLADALERAGYSTYLPQRDGVQVGAIGDRFAGATSPAAAAWGRQVLRRAAFALDTFELLGRCDAVVCNLNGRVPDEGSVVEVALAAAAGKALVLYKQTPVTLFDSGDNPMIAGLDGTWETASTLDAAVALVGERLSSSGAWRYTAPPALAAAAVAGAAVADAVEGLDTVVAGSDADTAIAELRRWVANLGLAYLDVGDLGASAFGDGGR